MPGKTLAVPLALFLTFVSIAAAPQPTFTYTPEIEAVLNRISPDALRGNLSFLASDLLEGRDTPSTGLAVAAEYIAAQFRKARLDPAGDDGYFQTARFYIDTRPDAFDLTWKQGQKTIAAAGEAIVHVPASAAIEDAPAMRVRLDSARPLPGAAEVAGKVLFADLPTRSGMAVQRRIRELRSLRPALLVTFGREDRPARSFVDALEAPGVPWITLRDKALASAVRANPAGATVSVRMTAAGGAVALRNVIGVLRGSDPVLRNTCILVTAHYDHVGVESGCVAGDCIYNGANDNASGTASLVEIANAVATLAPRPRRSIVFMTVFGEEHGILGSRHYLRRPVFPLENTVANVNLEQLGRTDSGNGPRVGTATFTGFNFSTLPGTFQAAGKLTGIQVENDSESNSYFGSSDNIVFAQAGIPAHTACVAYTYPDYHGVADHWDKIDYDNMARVSRMLALGVLMLANDPVPPRWNEAERRTAPYREAWKRRRGAPLPASQ